ncbi:MAG: ABC transporter ATP-binding protein [Proteobacteria bacterium]|nr:ABC transporter ATP-binding protein [Pseudomonadota bacterium]
MTMPLLQVEGLSVEFGTPARPLRAVDGVTFAVAAGESVGIVGESGSGKSVTALAVLRLISQAGRIVRGRVMFEGIDLLGLPEETMPDIRGRDIAMIFQEPMSSLNPLITIGDQIDESLFLHGSMDRSARRRRVVELLGLVGIPDALGRIGDYPNQFSGGMRQRVMIAMALACNPKLLIADEPTTALDVTIQAQVLDLIARIRATTGTAVLLISHDLGVVAEMCDRVVVMYAGRVVEDGNVRTIFRNAVHPYTQGLLLAMPRLSDDRRRLHQIPGSVPLPGQIQAGCPFRGRCGKAVARCTTEMPPLEPVAAGHRAACWVASGRES